MKLHDLLYGISFVTGLIGVLGIGGCIEYNEGWIASIVLIALCIIFGCLGRREEGIKHGKKRN